MLALALLGSSAAQQGAATGEPIVFATTPPPKGFLHQPYHFKLEAQGGITPLRWEVTNGSPPEGIELAPDGTLSGAPTEVDSFHFVVTVTDSGKPVAQKKKEFSIEVVDEHEASHIYSGNDGNLMFLRPGNLYLVCNMLSVEAFEIGTTQQVYWLRVPPADKMWKGTYARIAQVDLRQLPIAPEMILDVLGVGTIDDNLLRWPLPVMRFDNYRDAYALLWSFPLEDHWAAQKEVWYDRKSLLPVEVRLYDARGRMAVQALLSDPQALAPTQEDAAGGADAPRMATNYDLLFPETQTRLHLRLAHPSLRNGNIPNTKTFQVLQQTHLDNPQVKDVYDLDRGPATQP